MGRNNRKILIALASVLALGSRVALGEPGDKEKVKPSVSSDQNAELLIDDIRRAAYSHYDGVDKGLESKLGGKLRAEFIRAAQGHGIQARTWSDLERYFEARGQFLYTGDMIDEHGRYGNVIVAKIDSKKKETVMVNGKPVSFTSVVLGDKAVKGFRRYRSNGKLANSSMTFDRTVMHNFDVYGVNAEITWRCLNWGSKLLGELDYNVRLAEWKRLYDEIGPNAKEEFKQRFIEKSIDEANIHEAYHISVRGTRLNTNDADEEMRAVLHTYMNSPLGVGVFRREVYRLFHCSQNTMDYKVASELFSGFVQYIRKGQKKGRFGNIKIGGRNIREKVRDLYKLKKPEIREIASHLYRRKTAHRR